jgi:hypothetical protein
MGDNATNGYLSAFTSDGFSVVGSGDPGYWNSSAKTMSHGTGKPTVLVLQFQSVSILLIQLMFHL